MDRAGDQGRSDLIGRIPHSLGPPVRSGSGSATRFGEALFPATPTEACDARIRDRWGVSVLAVVGLVVLLGWYSSSSPADRVWAEDGVVFLKEAATSPFADTLLATYAGYAHVVPRIIAKLVVQTPVMQWAWWIAVASALVRVGVSVLAFHATRGYLASRPLRYAIAAVVLTLPGGSLEVLNSVANLHWFLLYGAVLAALWTPRSLGGQVVRMSVVSSAVLSDPVAIGVVPVLIARVALRRRVEDWVFLAVSGAATALQLFVVSGTGRQVVAAMSPIQLLELYTVRVGYLSVMGQEPAGHVASRATAALVMAAIAVVVGFGLLRRHPARPLIAACLIASIGVYLAAMLFMPVDPIFTPGFSFDPGYALRYGVAPMLLLLTAGLASDAVLMGVRRKARVALSSVAGLLVCLYVVGFVVAFRTPAVTTVDPWRVQVAEARDVCRQGSEEGAMTVEPYAWSLALPCRVLLDSEGSMRS